MTQQPPVDTSSVHQELQRQYTAVAADPATFTQHLAGADLAAALQYPEDWVREVPEATRRAFAGTGNPFAGGAIAKGSRVVDVGCGAGFDSLIAARLVGPDGQVRSIDLTPAMLNIARQSARDAGLSNVEFAEGTAEHLPVVDGWADYVIGNGVLNLTPEKRRALTEFARVLKPGRVLQVGEMVVTRDVPDEAMANPEFWRTWVAGALSETALEALVTEVGLTGFAIVARYDIYGAMERGSGAKTYGSYGITFRAERPV